MRVHTAVDICKYLHLFGVSAVRLDCMRQPELPAPWEEIDGHLPSEQQEALESVVGCGLTYGDLTDIDVTREGNVATAKSLRASYVLGHRWVRLHNADTGDEMVIRLQRRGPGSYEVYVSAVISPFQHGSETTGQQLRDLPVSAISAAYTAREIGGAINMNRALVLGAAINEDPLQPLPAGRVTDQSFLARVGRQYDALEELHSGSDIGAMMADINGVGQSTAKKWLTSARKAMFLMPVASGRKKRG